MRKLINILLIIPVIYLIITPVFLATSANLKPCTKIEINIHDSSDYHFVTKRQLLNLVYGNSRKMLGQPLNEIAVAEIEDRINDLKELRTAEVFLSIDGTLHV